MPAGEMDGDAVAVAVVVGQIEGFAPRGEGGLGEAPQEGLRNRLPESRAENSESKG